MSKNVKLLAGLSMNHSKELKANVHSIETFGAFDGPGIRYILFLQGCPFQCQFCHNRDSWSTKTNKLMTVDEIIADFKRYEGFYQKGGITVSGGEPLLQLPFLIELFKAFKSIGIHTCLDTSAACYNVRNNQQFIELMKYTDLVLLDIKQINDEKHQVLVGDTNKNVLDFARFLDELQVNVNTRHILIPGINDDQNDLLETRKFLDTLSNVVNIDVLPYITSGISKWEDLGLNYPLEGIRDANNSDVRAAEEILKTNYNYMTKKE